MKRGTKRLFRLAKILFTADTKHKKKKEMPYDQGRWLNPCGAPACALGHWAAHNPTRWTLTRLDSPHLRRGSDGVYQDAMKEFGIDQDGFYALFTGNGCGGAHTAKEASRFIREFAKKKDKREKQEARS